MINPVVIVRLRNGQKYIVPCDDNGSPIIEPTKKVKPGKVNGRDGIRDVSKSEADYLNSSLRKIGPTVALIDGGAKVSASNVEAVLSRPWRWGLAGEAWARNFTPANVAELEDGTPIMSSDGKTFTVRGRTYTNLFDAVIAEQPATKAGNA